MVSLTLILPFRRVIDDASTGSWDLKDCPCKPTHASSVQWEVRLRLSLYLCVECTSACPLSHACTFGWAVHSCLGRSATGKWLLIVLGDFSVCRIFQVFPGFMGSSARIPGTSRLLSTRLSNLKAWPRDKLRDWSFPLKDCTLLG